MITSIERDSLNKALNKAMIRELPPKYEEGNAFWIKAVVKLYKLNGVQSYGLAKHNPDGSISVTHDFGEMIGYIPEKTEVFPYLYLNEQFKPKFKDKEDMYAYLVSYYGKDQEEKIRSLEKEEIRTLVNNISINQQMNESSFEKEIVSAGIESNKVVDVQEEQFKEMGVKKVFKKSKTKKK